MVNGSARAAGDKRGRKNGKRRKGMQGTESGVYELYSTRLGNAREKAKDIGERRKDRPTRQGVRGEDENVDWPQIESHPFITLGLWPLRLPSARPFLFLLSSSGRVRCHCGQKSDTRPSTPFQQLRRLGRCAIGTPRIEFVELGDRVSCGEGHSHQSVDMAG